MASHNHLFKNQQITWIHIRDPLVASVQFSVAAPQAKPGCLPGNFNQALPADLKHQSQSARRTKTTLKGGGMILVRRLRVIESAIVNPRHMPPTRKTLGIKLINCDRALQVFVADFYIP